MRFLSPLFQLSRWLMIASSATAVLPVCRSPMMSWRWPRPMAVMASMALMPVCSGSFTGWRCTTEGACVSSGPRSGGSMSPLPSSGRPSGSTTRPRNASPTGTERISPVRRTSWPSSMCWASPMMTQPISRTSRLRARPRTPPSNSSSSLVMHECRPSTRAMPSPVSVTTPTSSRLAPASYDDTMLSSASRISSGRIVNSVTRNSLVSSFSGPGAGATGQAAVRRAQVPQDTAVDQLVADPHGEAADDVGVDDQLEPDVAVELALERLGQRGLLVVVQCDGARDAGDEPLPALGRELGELVEHALDGAATRGEHGAKDQRQRDLGDLAVEQPVEQVALAVGRQVAVGQRRPQLVLAVHDPLEPEELVLHL